ncbi:MAG TPA: SpoIIE family protein phosphatase [Armatimonadota bacterium]|nr:SpoIIE family protein phosphatase [Armatimonadota bacterium]
MRILIVDDDPDAAESLADNLEIERYQVDVAGTGAAARRLCDENPYNIIFLDLTLPDCSGLDLLPDIQKLLPDADVLVFSANTSLDVAVQAVNQGAVQYLLKGAGVDVPSVLRMVQRLGRQQEQRHQVEFQSLMLDNVRESVIATDLDGRITYWNHGAQNLYGWSREEMTGESIERLFADGDELVEDSPAEEGPRVVETVRRRKDGAFVEVEERLHWIRAKMGERIGWLRLSLDITERKESLRRLQEFANRERNIAVEFQKALLPEVPASRPGLEIARFYAPAWHDADVGGDFYAVFSVAANSTAMLLGDVSGKGLSAGVLMSHIRHVINAYAFEDERPREVLLRTNSHLAPIIPEERFVTVFYATFNPLTQVLSYASAGHEPAILRRADGSVELLEATGPMIGLDQTLEFFGKETPFKTGDLLLIYTDGASEAGGYEGFLGTDGLTEMVQNMAHLSVDTILNQIHDAVLNRCGGHLKDDLAMLCLRAVAE